jgi:hypothetical protein
MTTATKISKSSWFSGQQEGYGISLDQKKTKPIAN